MNDDEDQTEARNSGSARRRARGKHERPPLHVLTFTLAALAFFIAGSTWIALYPGVPVDLGGAPNFDSSAVRVSIPVAAGDHLNGYLLPGSRSELIIFFHGFGRDHTRAWRYAQFLQHAGYGVLAADFRSSRVSDRRPTTLGYYELEDARAMLDWVKSDPRTRNRPLALFGESLGGSVALAVAAEHKEARAVIVDCPFASGTRALDDALERWAHLPRWPAAPITAAVAEGLTGHDPRALDCVAAARLLVDRPILFIGSELDDRLSVQQTRDLWQAAGAKDSLWVLADCGHNQALLKHGREYQRRVLSFLENNL